jgi:hypothetical protein
MSCGSRSTARAIRRRTTRAPPSGALDNTSVYDWIEQHVPGGHGSPMGALLDAAYVEELAVSTQLQSSLNLIYLLGFNATPGNFEIYGKSDERFCIAGGNQQLPAAIARALSASTVKTGWRMTSIARCAAVSHAIESGFSWRRIGMKRQGGLVAAAPGSVLADLK